MNDNFLRIQKIQMPVTVWVHPEGIVAGVIFLLPPVPDSPSGEQPWDVLNDPANFLVIKRDDSEGVRFYNKNAIVRLEYEGAMRAPAESGGPPACRLTMMDGSLIEGECSAVLPVERSRLYDFMNDTTERFLKLYVDGGKMTLINKSYVVSISPLDQQAPAVPPGGSHAGEPAGRATR